MTSRTTYSARAWCTNTSRARACSATQALGVEHRPRSRPRRAHPVEDAQLLVVGRIAHDDLHQEPVPLRLRQVVDALRLDRVLRRQHQERVRHRIRPPTDRHLPLRHRLQQRRLHLRRRPVDLVRQHQVGHHRTQLHVERLLRRPVDPGPHDVRRHQIRGELDPAETAAHRGGQRRGRQRLRDARHALQQAVPLRQQRHQQPLDQPVLPHDHPLDLEQRLLERDVGRVGSHIHSAASGLSEGACEPPPFFSGQSRSSTAVPVVAPLPWSS